jgi:hypothetical protein
MVEFERETSLEFQTFNLLWLKIRIDKLCECPVNTRTSECL